MKNEGARCPVQAERAEGRMPLAEKGCGERDGSLVPGILGESRAAGGIREAGKEVVLALTLFEDRGVHSGSGPKAPSNK